jgi:formate dehydrogenase major subunit
MTEAQQKLARASGSEIEILLNGVPTEAAEGELLIEAILRQLEIPHICYHSKLMGPIQSCETCLVEVNGELVRACGRTAQPGLTIVTNSARAEAARAEAYDVILGNHMLYCTVCDNNNENCPSRFGTSITLIRRSHTR